MLFLLKQVPGAPSLDVELLKRGLLSPLEVSADGLVSEAFV